MRIRLEFAGLFDLQVVVLGKVNDKVECSRIKLS